MKKVIYTSLLVIIPCLFLWQEAFSSKTGNHKEKYSSLSSTDSLISKNWKPVFQKTPNDTTDLSQENRSLDIKSNGEYHMDGELQGNWIHDENNQKITFVDGLLAGKWEILQLTTTNLDIKLEGGKFPIEIFLIPN